MAQVPALPRGLPLFRLTRSAPPLALVRETLATDGGVAPVLSYRGKGAVLAAYTGPTLRAVVDLATGDAEVFPLLDRGPVGRQAAGLSANRALAIARRLLDNGAFVPRDATVARLGRPLFARSGATLRRARSRRPARTAHLLPGRGRGSRERGHPRLRPAPALCRRLSR